MIFSANISTIQIIKISLGKGGVLGSIPEEDTSQYLNRLADHNLTQIQIYLLEIVHNYASIAIPDAQNLYCSDYELWSRFQ